VAGVGRRAPAAYSRGRGRPASTLRPLGPGPPNGLANLHNAKKAVSGIVNIGGEHARYHIAHDAPLTSDIEGVAAPMSHWVKTSPSSRTIAADGALAIAVARQRPGQIATLILPADTAWNPAEGIAHPLPLPPPPPLGDAAVAGAAAMLCAGQPATLLLGGEALSQRCLELAGKIAAKTGCGLLSEGANSRLERGRGRVQVERIPYVVDKALAVLRRAGNLGLVGAREPVAFFAYPGKPSLLMAEGTRSCMLADLSEDIEAALAALAQALGASHLAPAGLAPERRPAFPTGSITPAAIASILGAMLPEHA